jgi:glycosyltransferase involved in cell wall biosynthesis
MVAQILHVVIPAYGSSPFLREAIQSAINAVDSTTPITVIDDASLTSDVARVSQEFAPRVSYTRNPSNLGLATNFLHSFNISQAEFTVVMGSDDLMLPGFEDALRKVLDKHPNTSVLLPNVSVVDGQGNPVDPLVDRIKSKIKGEVQGIVLCNNEDLIHKLFIGNFVYFPATAWRTSVMRSIDWDTRYEHAVDMDLLFKLAIYGETFVMTEDKTFLYRRHSESISSKLALEDTRLAEELAVHFTALSLLPKNKGYKLRLVARLAPTVRAHALIIGLKQLPKNPIKGLKHLFRAMGPLKPLASD